MNYNEIIEKLYSLENKEKIAFKKAKFAINANKSLGIYHKDLKEIARKIGINSSLAMKLYDSGIYEAKILSAKIFDAKELSENLFDKYSSDFENWEICDSFCMGLFVKNKYALKKIKEYKTSDKEFVKRSAFTMMAAYGFSNKNETNEIFEEFLEYIYDECKQREDNRVYVKKAVNWALRNIGKRNKDLNKKAITTALKISLIKNKTYYWISSNALKEIQNNDLKFLDYPRSKYRV